MARIIFIVSSLLLVSYAYAADCGTHCGPNESVDICGRLCEPSCTNLPPKRILCPLIECSNETTAGCRCNKGYYRHNVTGECVLPEDCFSCGENEQLGNCGRICEGTCTRPDLSECAATSCSGNGCQCIEGYLRDEQTDRCVRASSCPTRDCRKNEILAPCGRTCEGTCRYPFLPEICLRIRCAYQYCRCDLDNGYVRDPKTDECVHIKECHREGCPPNSESKLCGSICESTCRDPRERLCKIDPSSCTIDCRCLKGYVRNEETNECVKPENCCRE